MKIRNGFVSNSSSSCYVIVVPMQTHYIIVDKLSDYQRAVVHAVGTRETVLGRECFVLGDLLIQDCSYNFDDLHIDVIDDTGDGPWEAVYEYREEAKKRGAWEWKRS